MWNLFFLKDPVLFYKRLYYFLKFLHNLVKNSFVSNRGLSIQCFSVLSYTCLYISIVLFFKIYVVPDAM